MKKSTGFLFYLLIGASVLTSCCDKDDDVVGPPTPPVAEKVSAMEFYFDSRYGSEDLVLGKSYLTAGNEQVEMDHFTYFISNVELVKEDGTTWKEPDSYHLITLEDQLVREKFTVKNIPEGNYTKFRFMLGVDSVRNQSMDLAVGDLAHFYDAHHMTWEWDTGYIFLSTYGHYEDTAASPTEQVFKYNIGKNGRQRMVELSLPATVAVSIEHNPKVHIYTDAKKVFGGPNVIQLKDTPHIDGSPLFAGPSSLVADNGAVMFEINQVQ